MRRTSLTTAVIAGVAGVAGMSQIAEMPGAGIDPFYRIGGIGTGRHTNARDQRGAARFDSAKRKAKNKRAKQARARNRK